MSLYRPNALGALTTDQIAAANAQLESLIERVGRQNEILNIALDQGFDRGLVQDLLSTHQQLQDALLSLSQELPDLSTTSFDEWGTRAGAVEAQISQFETAVTSRLQGGEGGRITRFVAATIGAIGVVALLGVVVYQVSGQARRTTRRRRRRHRKYG